MTMRKYFPLPHVVPTLNLAACLLFIALREPAPAVYVAELDKAREHLRRCQGVCGEWYDNTAVMGFVAGRLLYSWSDWHGGEDTWVKVLVTVNLPAVVVTLAGEFVLGGHGNLSPLLRLSAVEESWVWGIVFASVASLQWWAVGRLLVAVWRNHRESAPTGPD
jgi:hypothetical protein